MREREMGKFNQEWKNIFDGAEMTPSENVWQAIDSKLWLSENTGFEKGWKRLFLNAELTPAENVWKEIDATLLSSENAVMKKRLFIYQRIAAVSIGVLLMFGAYSWFKKSDDTPSELTYKHKLTQESNNNNLNTEPSTSPTDKNSIDSSLDENQSINHDTDKKTIKNSPSHTSIQSGNLVSVNNTANKIKVKEAEALSETPINSLGASSLNNTEKKFQFEEGPLAVLSLVNVSKLPHSAKPNDYSIAYRLADARPAVMIKKKREAIQEDKFAALSFAAGSFSPGVGSAPVMDASNRSVYQSYSALADKSSNIPNSKGENVKPGTSFAMAITAGKRIFKRFILQGGVSYFNQNSTSTSEIVNVAPANEVVAVNSFKPETTNSVTYQSQQDINSTFQFISVPVQLGYMIVDRRLGVQINGGLSPDFFLGNSIYNESTQVETIGTSGGDGAFNTVSLAGLGSIEFSYKFFDHYRLSLAPGIKYSLTSIYNQNTFASAKPLVADIGLRFRYIF